MHRAITLIPPTMFSDIRAPEVRKLLGAFDKESYVIVSGKDLYVLTDNSILYYLKLNIDPQSNMIGAFQIYQFLSIEDENILIYDIAIYEFVMNKVSILFGSNNREIISQIQELRGNEDFEKLLEMKAAEGMSYYKLPRLDIPGRFIMIPIFSGFPKLSKPDTIGITAWKDDSQNNILILFSIFKKNINRNIDMYFRILDI